MIEPTDLYVANPGAARKLIETVPEGQVDQHELLMQLPWMLEAALELILDEIDIHQASPGATGCRILAAAISRLES